MLASIKYAPSVGRFMLALVCGFILGSYSSSLFFSSATQGTVAAPGYDTTKHFPVPLGQSDQEEGSPTIPPIVHFVQLKEEQGSQLHFSFESFLALYAAYHYVEPTTIYIHHDFSPEEIANASRHGSSWTRQVLTALPSPCLRLNRVTPPMEANGRRIERVEHRSDFVRLEQLRQHGGIYLDWDVVTLRPLSRRK